MRKVFLTLFIICSVFCTANAQKIGHFSFDAVMQAMPAYVEAQSSLQALRQQYVDELKAAEQEFSEKYELFIEQQAMLAPSIREKRQADLQDMYKKNVKFRVDSEQLLKQTEQDAMAPIKARVQQAINAVGEQSDYLLIVNTDSEACPYINAANAVDVTADILHHAK